MRRALRVLAVVAALAATLPAVATAQIKTRPPSTPGEQLRVYLVTMGVGDLVWEKFGHNAIRIVDDARGTDISYNWGIFDFAQPGFVWRFLTGDTRYWMAPEDTREMLMRYASYERSIWLQELALTPAQRAAMRDFVEWNARPENRYYRYDYYRDNCSTRVRDAIDRIVGGQVRSATESLTTTGTYRSHTARLTGEDLAVFTGITLALGQPADRPITAWEEMFVPMAMRDRLRAVQLRDEAGGTRPLVASERVAYRSPRPPEAEQPPRYTPRFLAAGFVLAAAIALLGIAAVRGRRAVRVLWAALVTAWSVVAGVAGVLLLLVYATRHVFMWHNENALQFVPLSLLLAVLLPLALARGERLARAARAMALLAFALSAGGVLLKALPAWRQLNWELIALALPVHAAVAWSVARVLASRATGSLAADSRQR